MLPKSILSSHVADLVHLTPRTPRPHSHLSKLTIFYIAVHWGPLRIHASFRRFKLLSFWQLQGLSKAWLALSGSVFQRLRGCHLVDGAKC
ncbi:hypothetical protein KC19_2G077800 [Ceratodon purpureus]|uniref:Uncharacterized protein n=1 Tax=Ceratodon purpureus TaxID=3225 RepID=A0A8T0IU55_CERPU|nr:hypothetical protein KC19_2G077800 [Ceratodon purpureus]